MMREFYQDIYDYARKYVPHWKAYADKSFLSLPVLHKEDIRSSPESFISDEYTDKLNNKKAVITRRTSGSTGEHLKLHWDRRDNTKSLFSLWMMRQRYYGILPSDKYCFFNSFFSEDTEEHISTDGRFIRFSKRNMNKSRLYDICKKIIDFSPKWMMMQPSMALMLCETLHEHKELRFDSLRYVELSGEMLFPVIRKEIGKVFRCKVVNQYGCNEVNSIAYECPVGNLHIMTSNVFVEIMDKGQVVGEEEEGNIAVTSLTNHAMPFLRYDTGDIGKLRSVHSCPCGNTAPILTLSRGRENDFVLFRTGERLTAFVFIRPINYLNNELGDIIRQFHITQSDFDSFIVKMVLSKKDDESRRYIESHFSDLIDDNRLKKAQYDFEFSDEFIENFNQEKLAFFIRDFVEGK